MSNLQNLLSKIRELPPIKQRGVAAIIGATVADAASRPLHWIYNQETLKSILGNETKVEFWFENKSPFYSLPLGERSSYNEEAYVSLYSLYENNGMLSKEDICTKIVQHFGPNTRYEEAYKRRKVKYDPATKAEYVPPIEGPWIHGAVINFLEKYAEKAAEPYGLSDNKDLDGFFLALPVIARNAEEKNLWDVVSPVASLFSSNERATSIFHMCATMLSSFILNCDKPIDKIKTEFKEVYPELVELLNEVDQQLDSPFEIVVAKYGKACGLPGSFVGAYICLQMTSSFVDAVRLNITGGGCNCSRANLIGAFLGAKYGIDSIPIDWLEKVVGIEKIMDMAIGIFS